MTEQNELARLEGFVSTLLERFNNLQAENKELNERIERRDASIEELRDELSTQKNQRSEISTRVSSLIDQIEEWESTGGVAEDSSEREVELESELESDKDTEGNERNDSGVQGNLFNTHSSGE